MHTFTTVEALREQVRAWKHAGLRVGFVPTMGNLHDGHYSLVGLAHAHADKVVASVFVNPTQFGPNEDFARYPRTLDADAQGLAAHGCDGLFAPTVAQMYPCGAEQAVQVRVPGITTILDGAHRPGHFDGVATVVARLFNMVQPDVAVFGRKDYQQLRVIDYLVRELAFPIAIIGAPIARAADGLALSSRNQYLSSAERAVAPEIHRALLSMRAAVQAGQSLKAVEAETAARLTAAGFAVDYAAIHRADLSQPADDERSGLIALIAARLGSTRLIDNLALGETAA
ncbi:MAG: pantoate--beta-alanine ligase [Proteobacteria bacterium]|nr:pantoate--beta-alanine ligase [Pseudomonadota bacterium]